jgi:hypothetical protein
MIVSGNIGSTSQLHEFFFGVGLKVNLGFSDQSRLFLGRPGCWRLESWVYLVDPEGGSK